MKNEQILYVTLPLAILVASIGVGFAGASSAQTTTSNQSGAPMHRLWGNADGQRPDVFGKVTSVSGTTLTVESTNPKDSSTTTYTVDASNAKVMKGSDGAPPTNATVADIAVGDMVAVRGEVSGTNVTASAIMDGMPPHGPFGHGRGHGVVGEVTSVNGSTVTITGKDGTTYTIDGSGAIVGKISSITIGDIQVGDTVAVQGEADGTSITAKHIMDGIPPKSQQ